MQGQNLAIQGLLKELIATLLEIAKNHTATIMPGMTHLQHAQPVSFAFHLRLRIALLLGVIFCALKATICAMIFVLWEARQWLVALIKSIENFALKS